MIEFLVRNLIAGNLLWEQLENSKKYSKYCADVAELLDEKGYEIDNKGNCVKKGK